MSFRIQRFTLVALALLALLVPAAYGHGYMTSPTARNSFMSHYCPHCANGQGPCGGGGQWPAGEDAAALNGAYTTPLTEYRAGQVFEVQVKITAAHKGHFVMELCRPSGGQITHECFQTRLNRDPTDTRHSAYIPEEPTLFFFAEDRCVASTDISARFVIPADFPQCEHCVMRWFWQSANSCGSHALQSTNVHPVLASWRSVDNCPASLSPNSSVCGKNCPDPKCAGERFANCADVRILGGSGPIVTPPTLPPVTRRPVTQRPWTRPPVTQRPVPPPVNPNPVDKPVYYCGGPQPRCISLYSQVLCDRFCTNYCYTDRTEKLGYCY